MIIYFSTSFVGALLHGLRVGNRVKIGQEGFSRHSLARKVLHYLGPWRTDLVCEAVEPGLPMSSRYLFNGSRCLIIAFGPWLTTKTIGKPQDTRVTWALALNNCDVDVLRFVRSQIQELKAESATIKRMTFQGGKTGDVKLANTTDGILDCAETELQLSIKNSQIKGLNLTNTALQSSTIAESSIVLGPSYGSTLRGVQFDNVLFTANDEKHLRKSTIENVLFDKCIFLYVDFDNDLLMAPVFRQCVFIRCYVKNGLALDRLRGSRGVFQYVGLNKTRGRLIEISGQPFLWTTKKTETAALNFQYSGSISAQGKDRRIPGSKQGFPWEDALVHAFPLTKGHDFSDWKISEIGSKLAKLWNGGGDKTHRLRLLPL